MTKAFPVIDPVATGENITRLRKSHGLSVRDLQNWFGFEEPQAIYKWQKGKSLPSVDNLYALSALLEVPIEGILVAYKTSGAVIPSDAAPLPFFSALPGSFEYGKTCVPCPHFSGCFPSALPRLRAGTGIRPASLMVISINHPHGSVRMTQ